MEYKMIAHAIGGMMFISALGASPSTYATRNINGFITFLHILMYMYIGLVATKTVGASVQETKPGSFLTTLLRVKRFDFNMYGCGSCHPVMQCGRDSDCHASHGRQYECVYQCCSFLCVQVDDRDDHRGYGKRRSNGNGQNPSRNDEDQRQDNKNEDEIVEDIMETATIIIHEMSKDNVTIEITDGQRNDGYDVTDDVMNP